MEVRRKEWQQFLPKPLDEVWNFFSRPENLDRITPDDMSFDIITDLRAEQMYEGMIIQYKVSPVPGLRFSWVTEITHITDQRYFIDEQRFGPYAFWHHQHHFEPRNDGVLMRDILHYKVPYWIIGDFVNAVFVEPKIEEIFRFRKVAVERIFNFEQV